MKKYAKLLSLAISLSALFVGLISCGGDSTGDAVLTRMDSLQQVAETKTRQYDDLSMFMTTIAQSLDSIAYAEDMLVKVANPETGETSREAIRNQVNMFAELIQRQKARIAALTDSLSARGNTNGADMEQIKKLNGIIDFLNLQLDAKDQELKSLQSQLSSSKASVAQLSQSVSSLKSNVSTLKQNVATLETKNEKLDEALTTQDEVINEGYIKIGTKKDLEAAGVLTKGGLFKKRKVNYSGFSGGGFQRVDIRHATSIPFSGKKAKLLTAAPGGSYSLSETSKGHWVLTISNPTSFWSISNYCIIQTD